MRKLHFYLFKKYHPYCNIPLDTTHLPPSLPYYLQKLFRVPRFVLNIGFQKRVPLIQRGTPPFHRRDPYLDKDNAAYRNFIKSEVMDADIFDKHKLQAFFKHLDNIEDFNFFVHHGDLHNLYTMFRLAYALKKMA